MALLKQSTAYTRAFLLVESSDHVTGLTGATVSVSLSKAGAAFAAAGGTVTEISDGWYKIALTTTDTGTLGDLAFHITATSADPTDFADQVVPGLPGDAGTLTAAYDAAKTAATAGDKMDLVDAPNATAVTAIQSGLSTYAGGDTTGVTTLLARLTSARGGYLDNIQHATVAGYADVNIKYVNATAITGNGASGTEWGPA